MSWSRTLARRLVPVAVLAALLIVAPAGARSNAKLTIFAAASLTEVFQAFDGGQTYSFAGSNTLAAQIKQGAPADVFASASPTYTQDLFRQGLVEKPVTFTTNRLVLIVPKSNPAGLTSVYDLARKPVKLVVAAPAVPVGVVHAHRPAQDRALVGALEGRQPGVRRQGRRRQGRARPGRRRLRLRHRREARRRRCDARSGSRPGRSRASATRSRWSPRRSRSRPPGRGSSPRARPRGQAALSAGQGFGKAVVDRLFSVGARRSRPASRCSSCCSRSWRSSCACRPATSSRRSAAAQATDALIVTIETNLIALAADHRLRDADRLLGRDEGGAAPRRRRHARRAPAGPAARGRRHRAARRLRPPRPARRHDRRARDRASRSPRPRWSLAITFVASPFYVRSAVAAFESLDPAMIHAAAHARRRAGPRLRHGSLSRSPPAASGRAPRSRSPAASASSARRSCSPAACRASPRRSRSRSTSSSTSTSTSPSRSAPSWS